MKNFIIFGASKGLGEAFVQGLPEQGDQVWVVSRTRPRILDVQDGIQKYWIEADLAKSDASHLIANALHNVRLDVLIYNVGIWESKGFRDDYDFEQDDPAEIVNIININVTSAITCIQKLLPNLKQSDNAKIFLIGSTAGLEHNDFTQVSFAASKFGLRGIGNAIREHVKKYEIGVTCINPGEIATQIPLEDGVERVLTEHKGTQIPLQDMVSLVKCVMNLSKASCVKEINMPAMLDANA